MDGLTVLQRDHAEPPSQRWNIPPQADAPIRLALPVGRGLQHRLDPLQSEIRPLSKHLLFEVTGDLHPTESGAPGPKLTGGGGFGLALSPDGQLLYVAQHGDVLIVDRASLALLRRVSVGGFVRRLAVRADGVALAANEGGWVNFIK